jgi:hypothetical protein
VSYGVSARGRPRSGLAGGHSITSGPMRRNKQLPAFDHPKSPGDARMRKPQAVRDVAEHLKDIPTTEHTSAWRQQARACSLCDHLVSRTARRAPSALRISREDDLSLVSGNLALAADPAVHQLTEAPLILHSGLLPIDAQSPRIEQCRRCKGQREQARESSRASQ